MTGFRWSTPPPLAGWLVAAAFFFYAWVLRVSPSVMIEELMRDFAVSGALLGQLSAWYFYGYAGMQIPVGMMLDRFGPRRLLTVAAITCAIGCVLFASGTLIHASIGRFLIGAGAAFSLVGSMAIASKSLPAHRFALFSGLAMMAGMAGGVLGQGPVRVVVEATDWRSTTLVAALGGAVIALFAWLLIRDPVRQSIAGGAFRGARAVLANRECWLNAAAGLACTGPLLGFAALWGVPFLETAYGLERATAAGMASLTFVGLGVGSPVVGWLSDKMGRRKPPMLIGLSIALSTFATLVYMPGLPLFVVGGLCLLVGIGAAGQICNFALVREHNAADVSATAIGLVNALITSAGAIYQPLIGWLLDRVWAGAEHAEHAGSRVYEAADYRMAFSAILIGGIFGLGCGFFLKESAK
ncbi:MAG: MFS family permease [Gammaproteobacteria bacterium]